MSAAPGRLRLQHVAFARLERIHEEHVLHAGDDGHDHVRLGEPESPMDAVCAALRRRGIDPLDVLTARYAADTEENAKRSRKQFEAAEKASLLAARIRRHAREETGSARVAFEDIAKELNTTSGALKKEIERARKAYPKDSPFFILPVDPRKRRGKRKVKTIFDLIAEADERAEREERLRQARDVAETSSTLPSEGGHKPHDERLRRHDDPAPLADEQGGRGLLPPTADAPGDALARRRPDLLPSVSEQSFLRPEGLARVDRIPQAPLDVRPRLRPCRVKRRRP